MADITEVNLGTLTQEDLEAMLPPELVALVNSGKGTLTVSGEFTPDKIEENERYTIIEARTKQNSDGSSETVAIVDVPFNSELAVYLRSEALLPGYSISLGDFQETRREQSGESLPEGE